MEKNIFTEDLPEGAGIAPAQEGQKKDYKPSEKTIERLNKVPAGIWPELGIDIDKLIKETNEYGILEDLAYGQYTKPIAIRKVTDMIDDEINVGKRKSVSGAIAGNETMASVRVYYDFNKQSWNYNMDIIKFVPEFEVEVKDGKSITKLDKDGKPVVKRDDMGNVVYKTDENGQKVISRNKYTENEKVELQGNVLSAEDKDKLNLTGNLGRVLSIDYNGSKVPCLVSVHPYDKHVVKYKSCAAIENHLNNIDTFQTFGKYGGEYVVTEQNKRDLVNGKETILKPKENIELKPVTVQYNALYGTIKVCKGYLAIKQEQNKRFSQKESVAQSQSQSQGVKKH